MPDWLPSWAGVRPWHWWIFGALLLLLELTMPGVFFVWTAVAAFATGLLVFVLPIPVGAQVLLFALLSVLSVYFGRRYVAALPTSAEADRLNQRGQGYVGRQFVVSDAILNGVGKVRVGDSVWRARGPDAPQGATVRVTGVDGTTLLVERVPEEG